jgi:hypothetical protein
MTEVSQGEGFTKIEEQPLISTDLLKDLGIKIMQYERGLMEFFKPLG